MPVLAAAEAVIHELHGTRFTSYARSASGSAELCAWRVDVPAGTVGQPHRPSREEILCVVAGQPRVVLDGRSASARPGDVILVPAGASFQLDNPGDEPVTAWVSTSIGLQAELPDGSRIAPPWAQ